MSAIAEDVWAVIAQGVRLTGDETFLGEDEAGHSVWLVCYYRETGPQDGGGKPMYRCGTCGGTTVGLPPSEPCPGYTPWSDEAHAAAAARVGAR